MKDDALDKWISYLFLNGSDSAKYGTLIKSFQSQFSLGNNQYPKDLTAATDALSNHRYDQQFYNNRDKRRRQNQQNQQQTANDNNNNEETSFAQCEQCCYVCGDPGHLQPDCPQHYTKPRQEWYVNRALQNLQDDNDNNDHNDADDDDILTASNNSRRSEQQNNNNNNNNNNS